MDVILSVVRLLMRFGVRAMPKLELICIAIALLVHLTFGG